MIAMSKRNWVLLVLASFALGAVIGSPFSYDAGHADGFHEANAANNDVCHGTLEDRP